MSREMTVWPAGAQATPGQAEQSEAWLESVQLRSGGGRGGDVVVEGRHNRRFGGGGEEQAGVYGGRRV